MSESPEALQKLHAGLEEMRAHLRLVLASTCDGCGFEARTSKQTGSSGSTKRRDLGTHSSPEQSNPPLAYPCVQLTFPAIALFSAQDSVAAALASIRNEARSTRIDFGVCWRAAQSWRKVHEHLEERLSILHEEAAVCGTLITMWKQTAHKSS